MHLTISFQISFLIILIIATLAFFTYILHNGLSKLQDQVQQLGQIDSGLTPGRTKAISPPSTQTTCSKVHTLEISLVTSLKGQHAQVVIEFPHESWAAAFQSRCQYYLDPRWFTIGYARTAPRARHYNRHFVSMPIPLDVARIQFKRADDGLVFVCEPAPGREILPPWHWSHASFLWTPDSSSNTGKVKKQLRQVWSHKEFDDVFGPELNNRPRGELDDGVQVKTARRDTWHGTPPPPPPPPPANSPPPPPSPTPPHRREPTPYLASTRTRSNSGSRSRSKPARGPGWLGQLVRRRRELGANTPRKRARPVSASRVTKARHG